VNRHAYRVIVTGEDNQWLDWYRLGGWRLTRDGRCTGCGTRLPGVFDGTPGAWGPRRMPVRLASRQPR
jgi:hypothetical protein